MHSLPIFVVVRNRPVILIGDGDGAAAKRRLLERAGARVVGEDEDAPLAVVALDDDIAAQAHIARLRERSILVNAVDRPERCDFTFPAIVDRDPLLVAIGTGGASAGLAKSLRQRLERLLPAGLGALATGLRERKPAIRARWPDFADRRRAIDAALDEDGPLDPLLPHDKEKFALWLAGNAPTSTDRLVLLRLRSDDPHDLTIGEALLLGRADTIYYRPGVASAILDRARADAARIACDASPELPARGLAIDITPR